ncbi:UNVERIFIED_CONTAM: hypothetical protein FKN15_068558, partial [Acipenser sinensis]
VTTNGILAIGEPTEESDYVDKFPTSFGSIAPFLADLDTSDGVGRVYFREVSNPETLRLAAEHINRGFPEDDEFNPTHTFIATWEDVAAHQETRRGDVLDSKKNTFQAVLASSDTASYAIFLYPRDGLQFFVTRAKGTHNSDLELPAKAGFSKGSITYFLWGASEGPSYPITSGNEQSVKDLYQNSNSGKQGVWVYEIGTSPYFTDIAPGEVSAFPEDPDTTREETQLWEDPSYDDEVTEFPAPAVVEREEQQRVPYPLPENQQPETKDHYGIPKVDLEGQEPTGAKEPHHAEPYVLVQPVQFQLDRQQYPPQYPQVVVDVEDEFDVNVFQYNPDTRETCSNSRHKCSNFADCRDYSTGYCCHCRSGFYGNGKHCLAEGKPQRMNGKVNGRVFVGNNPTPVEFSNNDLHSYVVANDGRAYVAISSIPESVGPSLTALSSLGGIVGWAFALEQPGYKNGFSITGGEFQRKAEVTFLPGNERFHITQDFKGIDEHEHLVVNTELDGRLPEIPAGSTVQIEPYTDIYQYSNTVITSSSTREYTVTFPDGRTQTSSYQWRDTITFQDCRHDDGTRSIPTPQQLAVDNIFVLYDSSAQLMRYATSNKIGSISGGEFQRKAEVTFLPGNERFHITQDFKGIDEHEHLVVNTELDGRLPEIPAGSTVQIERQLVVKPLRILASLEHIDVTPTQPVGLVREIGSPVNVLPVSVVMGAHVMLELHLKQAMQACCGQSLQSSMEERIERKEAKTLVTTHLCELIYHQCKGWTSPVTDVVLVHCDAGIRSIAGSCLLQYHFISICISLLLTEPEKTLCQRHRENILGTRGPRPIPGQYVPNCDDHGNYTPLQCHGSTGQCWCVDRNGQEIPGTRSERGVRPPCIDSGIRPPPPVGPTPRPDVHPLPPGTHLLFTQSGKIEHVPLEGYTMKKNEAKAVLHLPDSCSIMTFDCFSNSHLYWTDWNREAPKIEMSYMDGTHRRILVKDDLGLPNGLTYDSHSSQLCWADAGTRRVECINPNQTGRRKILEGIQYPFGITSYGRNLYYTDWRRDAIIAADRTAGRESDEFQPQKRSRLYGITTAYSQCPQGQNYCAVNNGGCTHLCLATPAGRSCRCPDNTVGVGCVERDVKS